MEKSWHSNNKKYFLKHSRIFEFRCDLSWSHW